MLIYIWHYTDPEKFIDIQQNLTKHDFKGISSMIRLVPGGFKYEPLRAVRLLTMTHYM